MQIKNQLLTNFSTCDLSYQLHNNLYIFLEVSGLERMPSIIGGQSIDRRNTIGMYANWSIFAAKAIFIGDDISPKVRRKGCAQPIKV